MLIVPILEQIKICPIFCKCILYSVIIIFRDVMLHYDNTIQRKLCSSIGRKPLVKTKISFYLGNSNETRHHIIVCNILFVLFRYVNA